MAEAAEPRSPSPAQPSGARARAWTDRLPEDVWALWPTGVLLAVLIGWLHAPAFADGHILGAPGTDTIRALWGFDHTARAWPWLPWWTDRVGFPAGVKLLVLPGVSTVLGGPFHALLGPLRGYTAWMLTLLWASGMAVAVLTRRVSGSSSAGLLASVATVMQPITLVAITDGTAEHVGIWALPATLAAAWAMRVEPGAPVPDRMRQRNAGVLAGVLATILALDSPYNVVFAAPFLAFALIRAPRRALIAFVATSAVGALLFGAAYYGLPVGVQDDKRAQNAIQLRTWLQWERGGPGKPWDFSLGATFVPYVTVLGALALAALRPLRTLPWIGIALACFVFGLGPSTDNARVLTEVGGAAGTSLGDAAAALNQAFEMPVVRFPRRWLMPMALALSVAAGLGVSRLPRSWMRALVALAASAALVHVTLRLTRYKEGVPHHAPPRLAFADFVRDHENDGAVLVVPRVRAALKAAQRREDLPVFASLGSAIVSADLLYIQVMTGRPAVSYPEGLRTLTPRTRQRNETDRLLHDLDDLTLPQTVGRDIPPSATGEPTRRAAAAAALVGEGLGFVVLDEATLADEGMRIARETFSAVTLEERHFDDGTGVTVLVLGTK